MSKPTFINSSVVYHDNSKEYNIDARGNKDIGDLIRACNIDAPQAQDITSAEPIDEPEPIDSIIFTKKAKKEAKETTIIAALRKSVQGRKDKTRAFVEELKSWQKEQYIDAHYNAKVMYDELEKITPLSFSYDSFRKYYNNLI